MEVAARGDAEAPIAAHLLETPALADGRGGVPGLDAVDALFHPLVHQRREASPGNEKRSRMGDDRETASRVDEGYSLFETDDSLGFVKGLALPEIAIECVLLGFRGLLGDEEAGDMRSPDLPFRLPVLARDRLEFSHRRLDAGIVHPLENADISLGPGAAQLGEGLGYFRVDAAEIEAEEVEFPGREGDLDFDAANEPHAPKGRFALRLGEAGDRIVVGERQGGDSRLCGEGDEFRRRITAVARRAVTMEIYQGSPPENASSALRPKTRMGMGDRGQNRTLFRASDARCAMDRRLSSSRGEVRPWGEGLDWV